MGVFGCDVWQVSWLWMSVIVVGCLELTRYGWGEAIGERGGG